MKLTLNLASRRYLNRRALNQTYLILLVLFCAALFYLVLGTVQQQRRIGQYRKNIAKLETQLEKLQGELPRHLTAEQIEKQKQEFAEAEAYLRQDAFRWTALFDRMEKRLPPGVSLHSFDPDYKDKSLVLTGVAKELSDLQRLMDNLLNDSFQQVFLQNQNLVEVDDGTGGKVTALNFSLKLEGVF